MFYAGQRIIVREPASFYYGREAEVEAAPPGYLKVFIPSLAGGRIEFGLRPRFAEPVERTPAFAK
jgi:hypothetical protein